MIDPKLVNLKDALAALGKLLDSLPKSKRGGLFTEMCTVEITLKQACQTLYMIRTYILDPDVKMGGEESPFVHEIDKLMPRDAAPSDDTVA